MVLFHDSNDELSRSGLGVIVYIDVSSGVRRSSNCEYVQFHFGIHFFFFCP
jgi:hypothetical protein